MKRAILSTVAAAVLLVAGAMGQEVKTPSPIKRPNLNALFFAEPTEAELEELQVGDVYRSVRDKVKELGESLLTWQKAIDEADSDRAEERARRGRLQAAIAYAAAANQLDLAKTPIVLHRMKASGFDQGPDREIFEKAQAAFNAAAADFKPGSLGSTSVLQATNQVRQVVAYKSLSSALDDPGLNARLAAGTTPQRSNEAAALHEKALGQIALARKGLAAGDRAGIAEAVKALTLVRRQYSTLLGLVAAQEKAVLKGHAVWVQRVAFSTDGTRLATSSDNEVKIWDAAKGRDLLTIKDAGRVVRFSPDDKSVVTVRSKDLGGGGTLGNWSYTLNLCDTTTGTVTEKLTLKSSIIDVSPDLTLALGSGSVGSLQMHDLSKSRPPTALKGELGGFTNSAGFTKDGKQVAAASNYAIKVWETATGKETVNLKPQAGSNLRLTISPDGKYLAIVGMEGFNSLTIWEIATSQRVALAGHETVYGLAFSPNGKLLATGSTDKTVKLWDVATGEDLMTLTGHTDVIYGVAFSPDGRWLASTGGKDDRSVRLWELDLSATEVPAPKRPAVVKVEPKKEPTTGPVDVVAAWKKAGVIVGWANPTGKGSSFAYPAFRQGGLGNDDEILAFVMPEGKEIALGKLPPPDRPFAIFYSYGFTKAPITEAKMKVLGSFKKLQILNLMAVPGVTDSGLKELAGLKELHTLNLSMTGVTDEGLSVVAELEGLQRLSLSSCYQVTEAGLKELAKSKKLAMLDVSHTRVSDLGWKQLSGLKHLTYLKLAGLDLSDEGVKGLAALDRLEILDLYGGVTNRGLKHLAGLQRLHSLMLYSTLLTDAGLKELAVLKSLKVLTVVAGQVTDAGLPSLAPLSSLEKLQLPGELITDAGFKEFAALKNLQYLNVHRSPVTDVGLKELAGLKNLRELHVVGSKVTNAGVSDLAKSLPELRIFR